ncbi:MAG: hypothetical protein LiPW31_17 [Microgenomates group bacterium LiPW_31]|nr:MAG: hypothetical protein LiPW31_17 [Microgenomates group bacterium LiPW_31]
MGEKEDLAEIAFVGAEPSSPKEKEEHVPEEVLEKIRKEGKLRFYTARAGTSFYSGPYPEAGEPIGRAEENLTIGVYTSLKRTNRGGQIFFPTTHKIPWGKREIRAWVGKNPGEKGFIRD